MGQVDTGRSHLQDREVSPLVPLSLHDELAAILDSDQQGPGSPLPLHLVPEASFLVVHPLRVGVVSLLPKQMWQTPQDSSLCRVTHSNRHAHYLKLNISAHYVRAP